MEETGIDGQRLLEYLGGFTSEAYRKQTLDMIVSDRLLKKFFDTPEGKKVSEFFTRRITENVSLIVQVALEWDTDSHTRADRIIQLGTSAGVLLNALKEMSAQMNEGEKHIKNIKKRK